MKIGYTIVENAGYVGERDCGTLPTYMDADRRMKELYDSDEIEKLHVDIALDGPDGRTYDF